MIRKPAKDMRILWQLCCPVSKHQGLYQQSSLVVLDWYRREGLGKSNLLAILYHKCSFQEKHAMQVNLYERHCPDLDSVLTRQPETC